MLYIASMNSPAPEVVDTPVPLNEDTESEVETKQDVEAKVVELSAQINLGKSTMIPFKEHKHSNKMLHWNQLFMHG